MSRKWSNCDSIPTNKSLLIASKFNRVSRGENIVVAGVGLMMMIWSPGTHLAPTQTSTHLGHRFLLTPDSHQQRGKERERRDAEVV